MLRHIELNHGCYVMLELNLFRTTVVIWLADSCTLVSLHAIERDRPGTRVYSWCLLVLLVFLWFWELIVSHIVGWGNNSSHQGNMYWEMWPLTPPPSPALRTCHILAPSISSSCESALSCSYLYSNMVVRTLTIGKCNGCGIYMLR